MRTRAHLTLLFGLWLAGNIVPGRAADLPARPEDAVRSLSERRFLEQSTLAEQAAVRARNPSDFSMELRPAVSDTDAGVGLRVYLPARWRQKALREQLEWVAQSEQLRVSALEDQALLAVYRDFCTYRMLRKQIALYTGEMEWLEPYLGQADQRVQQRQLAVSDRAKLYADYLRLLSNREQAAMEWIEVQHALQKALGSQADLEAFAQIQPIPMPTRLELDELLQQALESRADYQRMELETKVLGAAEAVARAEDGFHFKFFQPSYVRDYKDGEDAWALSAAFVLPWGGHNPDIVEYREKKELAGYQMALQRHILKERLQSLINASEELQNRSGPAGNARFRPLVDQLTHDLDLMKDLPLDQMRDRLQIRERMLDAEIQATVVENKREQLAIDFAEELGTLGDNTDRRKQ